MSDNLPKKRELPKISDLYSDKEMVIKETELAILLNAKPWDGWIREHPKLKIKNDKGEDIPLRYIPISIIEYLLTRIFGSWKVEIKNTSLLANSVKCEVRLWYKNPLTNEWDWTDGVGASPLQTDSGKGAVDFNFLKSGAVMMAAPSAESYAIKDAAEKLGAIFGKDLNRKDIGDYENLLKVNEDRYSKLDEQ